MDTTQITLWTGEVDLSGSIGRFYGSRKPEEYVGHRDNHKGLPDGSDRVQWGFPYRLFQEESPTVWDMPKSSYACMVPAFQSGKTPVGAVTDPTGPWSYGRAGGLMIREGSGGK